MSSFYSILANIFLCHQLWKLKYKHWCDGSLSYCSKTSINTPQICFLLDLFVESPVGGWSLSFITIVMEEFHILLGVLEVESQIHNSTEFLGVSGIFVKW